MVGREGLLDFLMRLSHDYAIYKILDIEGWPNYRMWYEDHKTIYEVIRSRDIERIDGVFEAHIDDLGNFEKKIKKYGRYFMV